MAEELRNVNQLDNTTKHEIADHFLDSGAQNLLKLGELFEDCERDPTGASQQQV